MNPRNAVSESLFRRIAKYSPSAAIDPRENRLTEVTAGVLDRVPPFARAVIELLMPDSSVGSSIEVVTQRYVKGAGYVDLVLAWTDGPRSRELWIEVKLDAGWSSVGSDGRHQIHAYLDEAERRPTRPSVAVIAQHPQSLELSGSASEVPIFSWGDVTKLAHEWSADVTPGPSDPDPKVASFLVAEYVAFLESEGLMHPAPVSTADLQAARGARSAIAAISRLVDEAEALLDHVWIGPDGPKGRGDGRYRHFPAPVTSLLVPGDYWIETKVDLTRSTDGVLLCGLTAWGEGKRWPAWSITDDGALPDWADVLVSDEFTFEVEDGLPRLWRTFDLASLTYLGSAAEQVQELGSWLAETFRAIHETLGSG